MSTAFTINTKMTIAGIPLTMSGSTSTGKGLVLKGSVSPKAGTINLTKFLSFVLTEFGIEKGQLGITLDFDIEKIEIELDTATDSFTITGTFKIDNLPATFTLSSIPLMVKGVKKHAFVFEADINQSIPIPSDIPVVGSKLSENLKLTFGKLVIATAKTKKYPAGVQFTGSIKFFDYTKNLTVYLYNPKPAAKTTKPKTAQLVPMVSESTENASPNNATKWITLNKTIGPIQLQKIGFQFSNGDIWALVDISAKLGGIDFSLQGFKIGVPLKFPPEPDLSFGINGVGLSYQGPSIELGGAFLKSSTIANYYSGLAFVDTPEFSINALGGYGHCKAGPSVFLFASLDLPLGGPPIFFVTGLSLGFGYNMNLTLPAKAAIVPSFPLLNTGEFNGLGPNDVGKALTKLEKFIYPSPNDYWFAVGIHFTSFELIQSKYLLTVDIHKEIIAILGLSALVLPAEGFVFVNVKLGIIISYNIKEGILKADAAIAKGSFIIDKDCKVQGEFAFYAWFKGSHSGNFVLSLGGYHPKFRAPSFYPKVTRVGFDWKLSTAIDIGGETYFALTPSSVMAGVNLHLLFKSGPLKAWLKAEADFLIQWKPFHYDIFISINIGASFSAFKLDTGASLHIFGPPFAGYVHIDWTIISFTIKFGKTSAKTPVLLWDSFRDNFLPQSDSPAGKGKISAVNKITISGGLLKKLENNAIAATDQSDKIWIVRAHDLSFGTQSKLPSQEIAFGTESTPLPSSAVPNLIPNTNRLGIRPMGLSDLEKTSHVISFTTTNSEDSDFNNPTQASTWDWEVHNTGVPQALWSPAPVNPKIPTSKTIQSTIGLSRIAPKAFVPASALTAKMDVFDSESYYKKIWLATSSASIANTLTPSTNSIKVIKNTFSKAEAARTALIESVNTVFGLEGMDAIVDDVADYSSTVEEYLQAAPLVGSLPSTSGSTVKAVQMVITKPPATPPPPTGIVTTFSLTNVSLQNGNVEIFDFTKTQNSWIAADKTSPKIFVYPGLSFLFTLFNPGVLKTTINYAGTNVLQLLCFDEFYHIITSQVGNNAITSLQVGGDGVSTADNVSMSQLSIMGLNPLASGDTVEVYGWSRNYKLPVANPYALVGEGFVLKPQAPVQATISSPALVSDILDENYSINSQQQKTAGWIDTNFLIDTTQQIIVLVKFTGTGKPPVFEADDVIASIPYLLINQSGKVVKTFKNLTLSANDTTSSFAQPELNGFYGLQFRLNTLALPANVGKVFRVQIDSSVQEDFEIFGVYGLSKATAIGPTSQLWKTSIHYFKSTNDNQQVDGSLVKINYTLPTT